MPQSASRDELAVSLENFLTAAGTMGFEVSWPKTKVQYTGVYIPSVDVIVDGHRVELVSSFCYLGSTIHSSGSCRPDVMCRIRIAAMTMDSL